MRLHYIQHVPFEGLNNIQKWADERGHIVSATKLYNDEQFPDLKDFDFLVIVGGPMGVYDGRKYSWLVAEKEFIKEAISQKKIILGICLGTQLIADVLGAKVYKSKHKEIGWYPVTLTDYAKASSFFEGFSDSFVAFHWHGDTFDLPDGAILLAKSAGCTNQAFEYVDRVIGLQFHLESSGDSVAGIIENCGGELVSGKYIQTTDEMLSALENFKTIKDLLYLLLDNIVRKFG